MKHNKTILRIMLVSVAVVCLTGCGTMNQKIISDAQGEAQQVKEASTFEHVSQELDTPQKTYDWMKTNITYRPDEVPSDEFCDAETTFARGYGDCDDYAMFADHVLTQHGYDTQVVSVYNQDQGHAVCVWKDADGKLNALSNSGIQVIQASDLMSVADTVYEDWKVYAVYPSNEGTLRPADR